MGRVWSAQTTISDLFQPCLYQQYWLDELWKVGGGDLTNLVHISVYHRPARVATELVIFMAVIKTAQPGQLKEGNVYLDFSFRGRRVCDGRAKIMVAGTGS